MSRSTNVFDSLAGKVVLVSTARVESLAADFGAVVTANEQLGRGSFELLSKRAIDARD